MYYIMVLGLVIGAVAIVAILRFLWELLQQNGRMLLRLEALEKGLQEIESTPKSQPATSTPAPSAPESGAPSPDANAHMAGRQSAMNEDGRANRFANRSLAGSKIKRDGLKAGTPAPDFRLPRVDGGELSLSELRNRLVLLVFSSPHCGPCDALAPQLEKFHRRHPKLEMVMISRGEPDENRAKIAAHGLTFPVVLQKQWEISRDYAYFATPVAYLIDGAGVITAEVAVGVDAVVELMQRARRMLQDDSRRRGAPRQSEAATRREAQASSSNFEFWISDFARRLVGWLVKTISASLQRLGM